ncbi:4148_t:CDS:1, partial [Scutellospora calospora]
MNVSRTQIPKVDSTSTIEETIRDKTFIDPNIKDAFPRTSSLQPVLQTIDEKN